MTGIPEHCEPETDDARAIARLMRLCHDLHAQVNQLYPDIADDAIAVSMINVGAQIGVKSSGAQTVASYLTDVARIIVPVH